MDPSALSVAARELRARLATRLGLVTNQVVIGHPSAAAREQENNSGNPTDLLNVFFFRVEYDGYPADGASDAPFYVRAYCLLTAFSVPDTGASSLSAGEKDLRMIGGAMQGLHEEPFVSVRSDQGEELAQLQVVPSPLSVDDINHIWATQGDLPYRLSVSYELALLPVPLAKPVERQPRVGALGLDVGPAPAAGGASRLSFLIPPVRVTTSDPAWAPVIRFTDEDGTLGYALAFAAGAVPAKVSVVGAGMPGSTVELVWDRWDSNGGWQPVAGAPVTLALQTDRLDAERGLNVPASAIDVPDNRKGQLQLTARRAWVRPDGATVTLRSNPLLISIYEVAP